MGSGEEELGPPGEHPYIWADVLPAWIQPLQEDALLGSCLAEATDKQTHTGAQTHTCHTHAWTSIHMQQTHGYMDTWTHGDTHTTHIPHKDRHTLNKQMYRYTDTHNTHT